MFRASDEAYEKPFVFGVGSQVEIPEFVFQPAPFPYDHPPGADVASLLYPEPYFASPPDSTQAASSPKPALVCRSKKDADRASQANAVAMEPATTEELELPPQQPLIGPKISSEEITVEYAKANTIFITKTTALPLTWPMYRRVRGDGNCGWRAIAFVYLETLVEFGSKERFDAELRHLNDLFALIVQVSGFSADIVEGFTEETMGVVVALSQRVGDRDASLAFLSEKINDRVVSDSIVVHMRLIAAAQLKANADHYAGFLEGRTAEQYCTECIMPSNMEIDHPGLVLLAGALLGPAGIVLETAYLDLSPSSQVNTYREPPDAGDKPLEAVGPMVCLLYRPGHYDILYRAPPPEATQLQVLRASQLTHIHRSIPAPTSGSYDFDFLGEIPGLASMPPGLQTALVPTLPFYPAEGELLKHCHGLAEIPPEMSPPLQHSQPVDMAQGLHGVAAVHPVGPSNPHAQQLTGRVMSEYQLPISPVSSTSLPSSPPTPKSNEPPLPAPQIIPVPAPLVHRPPSNDSDSPIRFHMLTHQRDFDAENEQPLQTKVFKNSQHNHAHFSNTNFQPEMWIKPERLRRSRPSTARDAAQKKQETRSTGRSPAGKGKGKRPATLESLDGKGRAPEGSYESPPRKRMVHPAKPGAT